MRCRDLQDQHAMPPDVTVQVANRDDDSDHAISGGILQREPDQIFGN